MAKKEISGYVKLQIKGGQANPAPPVGPALGAAGVNIMDFCKQFNARTQDKPGKVLPVVISVYKDKSFDFVIKTPPAAVQLLEAAKIKYTGSDSTSSLNAFDKLKSKEIFEKNGLEVPLRMMLQHSPSENNDIVIKPLREGSSFGVSIIKRWWDYKKSRPSLETEEALKEAQKYGDGVLIEKFIEGKELTVAIVGESTYPAIEIISPNEFYDFSAKYDGVGTKYIPANLSSTETKKLSEICLKAFKSLGCSGWGRVDLIKSKNDGISYILEVNTVPGMTETSLVPKAARLAELSFNDLLVEIIKTSID